ncbi:MAG: hypothetical protein AAB573_04115 [Patescibacteria group bacterium]
MRNEALKTQMDAKRNELDWAFVQLRMIWDSERYLKIVTELQEVQKKYIRAVGRVAGADPAHRWPF